MSDLSFFSFLHINLVIFINMVINTFKYETSLPQVNNHGLRISEKTAVFTTAVLEYMTHEILELSLNTAREENRSRIQPRHVNEAVKMDPELFRNFKNSSVLDSTFIPFDKMINGHRTTPHPVQDPSLPGPSNVAVTRPVSSRKSGSTGITRRKG